MVLLDLCYSIVTEAICQITQLKLAAFIEISSRDLDQLQSVSRKDGHIPVTSRSNLGYIFSFQSGEEKSGCRFSVMRILLQHCIHNTSASDSSLKEQNRNRYTDHNYLIMIMKLFWSLHNLLRRASAGDRRRNCINPQDC